MSRTLLAEKGHLVHTVKQAMKTSSQTACCGLSGVSELFPR